MGKLRLLDDEGVGLIRCVAAVALLSVVVSPLQALAQQAAPQTYIFSMRHVVGEPPKSDVKSRTYCGSPIRPMTDMSNLFAFYKPGASRSVIDYTLMSQYSKRVWMTEAFKKRISDLTAASLAKPQDRQAIGECLVRQLRLWADSGSMLKNLDQNDFTGHRQAMLIAVWTSIAAANGFAVAQNSGALSPADADAIRQWFARLSREMVAEFTTPKEPRPKEQRWLDGNSNHRYWASAAVGLMSVTLKDEANFSWAMNNLRSALDEANSDGSLTRELARGGRSLHYQNYAVTPLALLVALADKNKVVLTSAQEMKLQAIARFTADLYADPSAFEAKTGQKQLREPKIIGWVEILSAHFRSTDPELARHLDTIAAPGRPFVDPSLALPLTAIFNPRA